MTIAVAPPLVLSGPAIFFGGPYSNLHALDALLAEAQRRGVPASHVFSTGDLVAYCADPRAVVARMRAAGVRFIRGNCEEQVAANAADCGCGFAPGGACDRLSNDWYAYTMRQLDDADRAFLGAAPGRIDLALNGVHIAVIHGAATQTNRFVFASTPQRIKAHDLDLTGADVIVAGHSGLPFTQAVGGRLWHNPGALGMPANEGGPRVWYSVIAPGDAPGELLIEHCALDYDHAGAADAMAAAGLPPDYARTLRTGLWPNCDSLPPAEAQAQGRAFSPGAVRFRRGAAGADWPQRTTPPRLAAGKFADPQTTLAGEPRGRVELERLDMLWINTGTLCNLACESCYIESSPRNDRLVYISAHEVRACLDEIAALRLATRTIGFTGGEPFLNPELPAMIEDVLARGLDALMLTNAMKPMRRRADDLLALKARYGRRLALRVSLDHYTRELHELERGRRSFEPTVQGLVWLEREGFATTVAGRLYSGEPEGVVRAGYAHLFADLGVALDAFDPHELVVFPEMDASADVPEITETCWSVLGKRKADLMCASARMLVKRKGAARAAIVACTLLPYEPAFELGATLAEASRTVTLNHPHCATFCVLGGASCSQ